MSEADKNEPEQDQTQGRKKHWRSLAEELGAPSEPERADDEQVDGPDHDSPVEAAQPPRTPRPLPPRPPSDWFALANQLGLEVEPPAPEHLADETVEPQPLAEPPDEPTAAPWQTDTPWKAEPSSERREPAEGRAAAAGDSADTSPVDPLAADAFPPADVLVEFDESAADTIDIEFLEDSADARAGLGEDAEEFQAETTETEDDEEERPARRRRRRGRRRSAPADDQVSDSERDAVESEDELPGGELVLDEQTELEEGDVDAEEDEQVETTRKRRSRRRRRRSRASESSDSPADEQQPSDSDRKAGETVDRAAPTDKESSAGSDKAKHRKIPTWEEAISVIVASNMESRSKGGGSKGGGSRGRSRGSRRKRG